MLLSDSYKSIFLEPDWVCQKYYGWQIVVERANLRVLIKNVGPVKRYLVLSQLNHDQLCSELAKLRIFAPLSLITVKVFSNQIPNYCAELLIDGLRVPRVKDTERMLNKYTFVIDLTQELDKLWFNMNSHTKRLCQKAIVSGVVVESVSSPTDELLTLFFERYKKMANERSLAIPNAKLIRKMFEDGRLSMYYARNGNDIYSMVLVYSAALKSIFLYGVSGDQKNDGSGQFLHWKIIEHLKLSGQHWYDLGGVQELSDSNGIYRFKKGFGGESVDLGPEYYYCPVALSVARRGYKKLRSMI